MAPLGGLIALVVLWLVWGTSWPAMRTVFLENSRSGSSGP